MSSRQLVAPSRGDHCGHTFKLQAPPLQRKERRKGRLFDASADATKRLSTIEASPISSSSEPQPFGSTRFQERFSLPVPGTPEQVPDRKHGGELTLSPKGMLPNDARLIFPSWEGDDDVGNILTPRASHSSLATLTLMATDAKKDIKASRETSINSTDKASSHKSSTTVGTFGVLRRRSSAQAVHSPQRWSSATTDPLGQGDGSQSNIATKEGYPAAATSSFHCVPHMVISLSPLSPLSPARQAALHTPKCQPDTFDQLKPPGSVQQAGCEFWKSEGEPLSATLRRLGAARTSRRFDVVLEEQGGEMGKLNSCTAHQTASIAPNGWTQRITKRLDERESAQKMLEDHRQAINQATPLLRVDRAASDDAPDNLAVGSPSIQHSISKSPVNPEGQSMAAPARDRVQSTVRGGRQETLWMTMRRKSNSLAAYIFGNHQRARSTYTDVFVPLETERPAMPGAPRAAAGAISRGDGWGGLRPRASWFPDLHLGPLLSPASPPHLDTSARPRVQRLRSFHLRAQKPYGHETEWIDEETDDCQPLTASKPDRTSMHTDTHSEDNVLKTLRVRFPSYLPQPRSERQKAQEQARQGWPIPRSGGTVVTYFNDSAEGVPTDAKAKVSVRRRACRIATVLLIFIACGGVACIVLLVTGHFGRSSAGNAIPQQAAQSSRRRALVHDAISQS